MPKLSSDAVPFRVSPGTAIYNETDGEWYTLEKVNEDGTAWCKRVTGWMPQTRQVILVRTWADNRGRELRSDEC